MFFNEADYEFIGVLERNWKLIREEFMSLEKSLLQAWGQHWLYGEKGWDVFGLMAFGKLLPQNIERCPKTAEIVSSIPGVTSVAFSQLGPNVHIRPHVGITDQVYRLHLGVVVPEGCGIRVGSETRFWEEGKCMVFDDTYEHEAWNRSDQIRTVLLIDFLRPGVGLLQNSEEIDRFIADI